MQGNIWSVPNEAWTFLPTMAMRLNCKNIFKQKLRYTIYIYNLESLTLTYLDLIDKAQTTTYILTLYHTVPTFIDLEKDVFRTHCGKRRKCW